MEDIQISLFVLVALAIIAIFWWKPKQTSAIVVVFLIGTVGSHSGSTSTVDAIGTGILFAFLVPIAVKLYEVFNVPDEVFNAPDSGKSADSSLRKDRIRAAQEVQRKLTKSAPKAYGSKFRRGDRVRITSGKFTGQEGFITSGEVVDEQIVILLNHLGKQCDASVPVVDCELVRIAPQANDDVL